MKPDEKKREKWYVPPYKQENMNRLTTRPRNADASYESPRADPASEK
jgi:hypothetical protein